MSENNQNENRKSFSDDFVIGEGFNITEVDYAPHVKVAEKRKKKR